MLLTYKYIMKTYIRTTVKTLPDRDTMLVYDANRMTKEEADTHFISKGWLEEHFLCSVCGQDFGDTKLNAEQCCKETKRIVTDNNPANLRFTV